MPIVKETAEENMPASIDQSSHHKLGSVVIVEDDAEDDTET